MVRSSAEQARLESILFGSLEYFSKKRVRRELLIPGATRVEGVILGQVGRARLELPFGGELQIGEDQSAASSCAPDTTHVLALVLGELPEPARLSLLARLPKDFERTRELPAIADERLVEAKDLLTRLRSTEIKTRRGSVVYAIDPPKEGKAA